MGTITKRTRADGSTAYLAQISIMRDGKFAHRESRTFDREQAARAWLKKREGELSKPGALEKAKSDKRKPTLSDAIDKYISTSRNQIGRTKAQVLEAIKEHDIADKRCADIGSTDLVAFAQELATRMKPQTVQNYLSHLGSVFSIARPAWGYELDAQAMSDTFKVTKRLGLTNKSTSRERRPTFEELEKLMEHFDAIQQRRPSSNPMCAIIVFAIFSTRRLEEITLLRWDDLDEAGSRILVRDMKNPGDKMGNHIWCDLPEVALRVIQVQPRTNERIFPYNRDAISAAFTRACKVLGIEDLHFHDLRHEGVSRLFEMGLTIPHAAAVSGHRSWQSLKRYTHIRETGDKYEGWPWIGRVTQP